MSESTKAVGAPLERQVMAHGDDCEYCGKSLDGMFVGTGTGFAHSHCYNREHPPMAAQTLYQMARGRGDPVLAAEVIAQWVPHELAAQIVDDFNKRLMKQWQRRCEQ
jgi:hypothetical protein